MNICTGCGDSAPNTDPGKQKSQRPETCFDKALEAIRFGSVPIIVKMPPKAMPNASGSSCLEAGSLAAEQMPIYNRHQAGRRAGIDKTLTGQRR
ncbi:MAG: hypothetical protein ACLRXQ_09010 [Phascolarctobacterium faecium]